jgi:hypothetical protein
LRHEISTFPGVHEHSAPRRNALLGRIYNEE